MRWVMDVPSPLASNARGNLGDRIVRMGVIVAISRGIHRGPSSAVCISRTRLLVVHIMGLHGRIINVLPVAHGGSGRIAMPHRSIRGVHPLLATTRLEASFTI